MEQVVPICEISSPTVDELEEFEDADEEFRAGASAQSEAL